MSRTRTLFALGGVVLVLLAGIAVLVYRHDVAERYHPASPSIRGTLAGSCPARLGRAADVRNHGDGLADTFTPRYPRAGLICRYTSQLGPNNGRRYRSVPLDQADARRLAGLLNRIHAGVRGGAYTCPSDSGTATILVFGYQHRADVDVWYHDAGCPTVDNGARIAEEYGHPNFHDGFAPAVDRLAPPCGRNGVSCH